MEDNGVGVSDSDNNVFNTLLSDMGSPIHIIPNIHPVPWFIYNILDIGNYSWIFNKKRIFNKKVSIKTNIIR